MEKLAGAFVSRPVLRLGDTRNGEQAGPDAGFGGLQVIVGLKVEPVLRRLVQCPAKQQGQLSRHGASALDDMGIRIGDTSRARANAAWETPSSVSVSARNAPG